MSQFQYFQLPYTPSNRSEWVKLYNTVVDTFNGWDTSNIESRICSLCSEQVILNSNGQPLAPYCSKHYIGRRQVPFTITSSGQILATKNFQAGDIIDIVYANGEQTTSKQLSIFYSLDKSQHLYLSMSTLNCLWNSMKEHNAYSEIPFKTNIGFSSVAIPLDASNPRIFMKFLVSVAARDIQMGDILMANAIQDEKQYAMFRPYGMAFSVNEDKMMSFYPYEGQNTIDMKSFYEKLKQ